MPSRNMRSDDREQLQLKHGSEQQAVILETKEKEMGYKRVVITEFGEQKYSR